METLPNVFPKNETLTYEMLVKRLDYFRSAFHSIQAWRDPVHHARYRVLAKDNIGVEEFPTMAGSKALENLMLPDAFWSSGCPICSTCQSVPIPVSNLKGALTSRPPKLI